MLSLWVPRWIPTPQNQWHGTHWAVRARKKKGDRDVLAAYASQARLPVALGKRRVSLLAVVPPGRRRADRDNLLKSLFDALKAARLLLDDSPSLCDLGFVHYARAEGGGEWGSLVLLEDL